MSRRPDEDLAYFEVVKVVAETELALLCNVEGTEAWVPKSLINVDKSEVREKGDVGRLVIPEWKADDLGLL